METTSTRDGPWWLGPGPETCPHCLRHHHVEIGHRCVDCDGPVCPFCVVTVSRRDGLYACPSCRPPGEARR